MSESFRFDDDVVVVTGGGHGMGREHCLALGGLGATVVVVDIDELAASAVVREVAASGGAGDAIRIDPDQRDHGDVVRRVMRDHGRVDAIVK